MPIGKVEILKIISTIKAQLNLHDIFYKQLRILVRCQVAYYFLAKMYI